MKVGMLIFIITIIAFYITYTEGGKGNGIIVHSSKQPREFFTSYEQSGSKKLREPIEDDW